jgi:hypothetical protein
MNPMESHGTPSDSEEWTQDSDPIGRTELPFRKSPGSRLAQGANRLAPPIQMDDFGRLWTMRDNLGNPLFCWILDDLDDLDDLFLLVTEK